MNAESDLALLIVAMLLFGVVNATSAALRILAYGYAGRNGEEKEESGAYPNRLLEDAVTNYFALGIGRTVGFGFVLFAAHRMAARAPFSDFLSSPAYFGFLALSVLIPIVIATPVALRSPYRFVELSRVLTLPVVIIIKPLARLFIGLMRRVSPALVDGLASPILPLKSRIDLYGYKNGDDETDEQTLMSSVFEFGDTKVREIMVPRIDMVAVNVHLDPEEAVNTIMDSGHSRVPVFDDTIDKVIGVVHTKDLLKRIVNDEKIALKDICRDVYFVPESKMIDDLLSEFKKRRSHIAIAVDEYGGTAGLITLEDILEELVGDIQDEFDSEEALLKRIDDDMVLCNAKIHVDELNEALGLALPEGDVDTLGGFIYEEMGRVPRAGEAMTHGHLVFKIQSVAGQRIDKVMIRGLSQLPDEDTEPRKSARGGGD